ncbi:RHS repeat-associated core domain-containing protein [bacterium]|nr:RHS repeat-associated core domain-containing protein [bacterium]NUN46620.1 RHS repeat-associated core domain-containing protein [bacterium]
MDRLDAAWRLEHYNIYGNDLLGKLDSLQKRYYYLTDHLGSVRVTVKDTAGVPVDSWSDYYPFGKESRGSSTVNEPKEGYTSQLYDSESDLIYYKRRYYNQNIARFISVDPLTDKYPQWTPYQYAGNMPVRYIDLDGLEPAHPVNLFCNNNPTTATFLGIVQGVYNFGSSIVDGLSQESNGASFSMNLLKAGLEIASDPGQALANVINAVDTRVDNMSSSNNYTKAAAITETVLDVAATATVAADAVNLVKTADAVSTTAKMSDAAKVLGKADATVSATSGQTYPWGGASREVSKNFKKVSDTEAGALFQYSRTDKNGNKIARIISEEHKRGGTIGEHLRNEK